MITRVRIRRTAWRPSPDPVLRPGTLATRTKTVGMSLLHEGVGQDRFAELSRFRGAFDS